MSDKDTSILLDSRQITHALSRIAHEILESLGDDTQLAIIGIRSNGDFLADRLVRELKRIDGGKVDVGYMDITLYRDDLMTNPEHPEIKRTEILFALDGKVVVLVDDVLFTGRTIRAALNQIPDYGRPRAVRLAVLIDRGGRELPIRADFVGKNVPTQVTDKVIVSLTEAGGDDTVTLQRNGRVVKASLTPKVAAKRGRKK